MHNRPHIMTILVTKLCSVWMSNVKLSIPFFESGLIMKLLLYKEPRLDDHNAANAGVSNDDFGMSSGGSNTIAIDDDNDGSKAAMLPCRLMVLSFIEQMVACFRRYNESIPDTLLELKPLLEQQIKSLVDLNLRKVQSSSSSIGNVLDVWICYLCSFVLFYCFFAIEFI